MKSTTAPDPRQTLAELAATRAGASRVFHRHGLDFCCGGWTTLADACDRNELDPETLIAEIAAEERDGEPTVPWTARPLDELLDHILESFHEAHRREVPRLLEMARKVERVHADKQSCPHGLAAHIEAMLESLEEHMQKEELVLFPNVRAGRGAALAMPIQVMEMEHRDHGRNLERLRALANGYVPPAEACGTWQALYLGLAELERDLMEHIHLENNVLFPRTLHRS